MSEYFESVVPASQRTEYRESATLVAWLDAVRTWRAAGCVDAQPVAPDLMHAVEVWRCGVMVETQNAEFWRYDLRGLDLRDQHTWIGQALIKFGDRRLWATIGTQLPGEHAENFGSREAAISMALGLMRAITVSRGPCNDALVDAIAEQLVAPAEAILRMLATADIKGPTA